MAYYLAVERTPDSYEAINIKKTQLGRNLFLNNTCECTLEEIDRFTTQYINIDQLTHELYCDKTVAWPNSSVATVCVSDSEIITIEKELLFKGSKKYLDNPSIVYEYIIKELSSCNIEFATELYKKTEDISAKEKLMILIGKIKAKLAYDTPLDMNELINVADLLVYNTDIHEHQEAPRLYNYSKIHNAVLAIANYENKLKENKESYKRKRTKNT